MNTKNLLIGGGILAGLAVVVLMLRNRNGSAMALQAQQQQMLYQKSNNSSPDAVMGYVNAGNQAAAGALSLAKGISDIVADWM